MRISSTDNPIYRRLKQLATSARVCREAGRTLIEGVHLLQAALDARVPIITLVLRGGGQQSDEVRQVVRAINEQSNTKSIEFAPALYDAVSPVEHGVGVLAEIEFATQMWPERIVDDAIYLDNVQDPGNVGTLMRTAAAAGVRYVITGPGCPFIWSPKVMRAAMGAHFVLDLQEQVAPQTLRDAFSGEILAAHATDGEDLFGAEWGGRATLWLFGAEGQGLGADSLRAANLRLRVPIDKRVESLSVGAAAAVCLFEQRRRRSYHAIK